MRYPELLKPAALQPEMKAIPPCDSREFMTQLMQDNYRDIEIMMDYDNNRVVTLGDLNPEWWI